MERDDRTPVATFFAGQPARVGDGVELGESAAHHARVKRLEPGDVVRLTDGAGVLALGRITAIKKSSLSVHVDAVEYVERPAAIHLRVPIADRDRMLWLAEKGTELGVSTWQAVRFRRSLSVSPRGEGEAFARKLRARMENALEQSGGAWIPQLMPDATLDEVAADNAHLRLVLDAAGPPIATVIGAAKQEAPVVLVGPEGGIEPDEMAQLAANGWRAARLASTTLRFETAAIAAVSIIRAITL